MGEERLTKLTPVDGGRLDIFVGLGEIFCGDREFLPVVQVNRKGLEQRTTDLIDWITGSHLVKTHGVQHKPSRHLPAILVA